MKFDFEKLKEMNDLDPEQIAIWPFEVKIVVALFLAIIMGVLGYFVMVKDKLPALDIAHATEQELRNSYRSKYSIASNMEAYEAQLEKLREDFDAMLKSLPTSNETPGLLDDITFVGTSAGLTFRLLNWQQEIPKEFYAELPIQMEVTGTYHEFGQFLSDIAALPRIVTVHDLEMQEDGEALSLKLQAKTYRTSKLEDDSNKEKGGN
ncbi:type 4a pilus biogenesis protein PilO [Paraneptunicella aestuarii]|uniref:type 4a pilus biogenesis protein PilO n=1 Tax=Paraneptunicella aestuarii TaxID=2831148 RepID=UPI001E3DF9CC|nr:type 4a pilus biogenesis protein PilO [Paraneptunicella aestuarii]UAA38537.1 type 4a pilus biogenesis protein PilO [Paraneptunicella aestuarii]